ncbi:hypothetical protein [Microcoleus anatoxicus]|uniref:hypothetical protein n=1 Tax=Microcoleus anatoxicus TaxID=2705319 RepID=UPI0030C9558F
MGLVRAFIQQAAITSFPNTSAVTEPAITTTSAVILAAKPAGNRRGFTVENDGTTPIVIAYAATVSATARTVRLEINDYYEDTLNWQGSVSALSIGGAGSANVTELTIV